MKKLSILLCLCAVLFCSCGKADEVLDLSAFDENFREEHSALFYNESCEHDLRYRNMPDPLLDDDVTVYHEVSCYYGNCDFETHLEPHTVSYSKIQVQNGNPKLKENGCLYHRLVVQCEFCHVYPYFYIYVLCPKQDAACKGGKECLAGADWEEVLCDTPYVISYD